MAPSTTVKMKVVASSIVLTHIALLEWDNDSLPHGRISLNQSLESGQWFYSVGIHDGLFQKKKPFNCRQVIQWENQAAVVT